MKVVALRGFGLKVPGGRRFFKPGEVIETDDHPSGSFDGLLAAGQVKDSSDPAPAPPSAPEEVPPAAGEAPPAEEVPAEV